MEEKKGHPDPEEINKLLESLYRDHAKLLVELAQTLGCNPDFAEDIVQETFQVALSKPEALYQSENRLGWLILTMKNRIGTNFRALQYAQNLQRHLQELYINKTEDQIDLKVLYSGLVSEEDLQLLILHYVENYSAPMLADSMNLKVDTCKKRIQRARIRFLKEYEKMMENQKDPK